MVEENSTISDEINYNLDSPGELTSGDKKFWKENITNDDLIRIYRRKGIAFRTINKQVKLMFKDPWVSEDETAKTIAVEFDFKKYVRFAYRNALISGHALIYVDYGDVNTESDYYTEAPIGRKAIGYFVITKSWIARDKYYNREIYDNYEIFKADGQMFKVHESRFIRVQTNPEGISMLEPAYDSIMVLDNVLWGMGQTMFRSGSGFPVLSVEGGKNIIQLPSGEKMTRIQYYKKIGFLRDMNTQTGFIKDAKDTFGFEGAEGKAINPGVYYDKAFQSCAVDLDVPVDILKGVAAGAVTGSETNLKEYYGDLSAKQEGEIVPIYEDMFNTQNYEIKKPITFVPIFEQTQEEISTNIKSDVEAIHNLELYGYYTHEQAVNYFSDTYNILKYDDKEVNALKNLPVFEKQAGFSFSQSEDGILIKSTDEESALPPSTQKIETKYGKEMEKAFKDTTSNVTKLLAAFNTD